MQIESLLNEPYGCLKTGKDVGIQMINQATICLHELKCTCSGILSFHKKVVLECAMRIPWLRVYAVCLIPIICSHLGVSVPSRTNLRSSYHEGERRWTVECVESEFKDTLWLQAHFINEESKLACIGGCFFVIII